MDVTRREFLSIAGAGAATALSACGTTPRPDPVPITRQLIDAHCHVFNASDLPATRFIKQAILEVYPPASALRPDAIENEDFVDALINLLVEITTGSAPTAGDEIKVLAGQASPIPHAASRTGAEDLTVRRVADYLARLRPNALQSRGDGALRAAILRAAGAEPAQLQAQALSPASATSTARSALSSDTDIGAYFRWFAHFVLYRYALVDELDADHRRQGYDVRLLAPAMIDFSSWLGEPVCSSLYDQIQVMSLISRRPSGPPVHGYVAFDPLREALAKIDGTGEPTPLSLVKSAVEGNGFIGVKLYPPMGFRPWGNTDKLCYPTEVRTKFKPPVTMAVGLNSALGDLYDYCSTMKAPILAHAAESNGANEGFASRADPVYWLPVFKKWPELRVCLAHFGGFEYWSGTPGSGVPPFERTWEATIARHIRSFPDAPVFVDISYLSEVLSSDVAKRAHIADCFKRYMCFDPDLRHVLFGTDWIMLGKERRYAFYTGAVVSFLKQDVGVSDAQLEGVLVGNASRFLGLTDPAGTRGRLIDYYRASNLDINRLRLPPASA